MTSLKIFLTLALAILLVTVLLLPLAFGLKAFILVILAFSLVFVFVDATGKGKTFAALTIAALTFYLFASVQRGIFLLEDPNWASILLGLGLIVLPIIGAWAMVREIIFGSRVEGMAQEMDAAGQLPEDKLPRSASGRIDRQAADAEFENFRRPVEENPERWQNWFNLATLYGAAGDRRRARKAMRIAIALRQGKTGIDMSI